jgi:hypothetical protein
MELRTFKVQRFYNLAYETSYVGPLTLKAQRPRAWLLYWSYIQLPYYIHSRIAGVLNPDISSTHMLHIAESFSVCHEFRLDEQIAQIQPKAPYSTRAGFMHLNDGSVFEDHIVCSRPSELEAVRAYDIALYNDLESLTYLSWKEPCMRVEDGERILFCEDFLVTPNNQMHRILKDDE